MIVASGSIRRPREMRVSDRETRISQCNGGQDNKIAAGPDLAIGAGKVDQLSSRAKAGIGNAFGAQDGNARKNANTKGPDEAVPRVKGHRHIGVMGVASERLSLNRSSTINSCRQTTSAAILARKDITCGRCFERSMFMLATVRGGVGWRAVLMTS